MPHTKIDPEVRTALRSAQKMIKDLQQEDSNEAETRRRVERMLESLMGYDPFKHVTREKAIHTSGDADHCDFAIMLESDTPSIIIELKRIGLELMRKHLKQAAHYAIDCGCEWIVLTNGRQWELHHVSYGQPPDTQRLESWDLLEDDLAALARKFELIGYKSLRHGELDMLWQKRNVLTAKNLLGVLLNEDGLRRLRRELKHATGVTVTYEEVVNAVRRMLNENAGAQLSAMKITLPERKTRQKKKEAGVEQKPAPDKEPNIPPAPDIARRDKPEDGNAPDHK